jgi:hypothetical protein
VESVLVYKFAFKYYLSMGDSLLPDNSWSKFV